MRLLPSLVCSTVFWSAPALLAVGPAVDGEVLRLGFTYSMFVGVNENDARASIRALATIVARESGIPADPTPRLLAGPAAVAEAVRLADVDAVGLTTEEYFRLPDEARFDRFLFSIHESDPAEEYLILVRHSAAATTLAGLRAQRLTIAAGPRMSLAAIWLDVELAHAGLPPAVELCQPGEASPKPARAILNLFFNKTDAVLVTRRAFATMAELNPQIAGQLRVLAASPPLIPSFFAVRTGLSPSFKQRVIEVFSTVHRTPAGQQAMTIFQVHKVAEHPASVLRPSLDLLAAFAQLAPAAFAAREPLFARPGPAGAADSR